MGDKKNMKVKSKISYLGERNSILPEQMAEQLAVEVDVKNITQHRTDVKNLASEDTLRPFSVALVNGN